LLPSGDTLLKRPVLGLHGAIDEKSAEQPRARARGSSEPGVPADRAYDCAAAGADGRTGQRALLGGGHIGAGSYRQNGDQEQ
jgi:hypothetical protein